MKLRRDAFQSRVKKLEERQKVDREELVKTQERVAKNLKLIQALAVRGMDESRRRKALREFEIQSQQLAMRQQKEAEQLREMQLLKIRHMSEQFQLDVTIMTEMEELSSDQRERELEVAAEHRMLLHAERDKLDRQQSKLRALQVKEEQKIQRNHLKQSQRRQGKLLERQQRHGAKLRERAVLAETAAILGGEVNLGSGGSETDEGSESYTDSTSHAGTSEFEGTDIGADQDPEAVDMDEETRAKTEGNAAADADARRKRRAANDAALELQESLAKGEERVVQMTHHHKKLLEDLKSFHKDASHQRAREMKRKVAELMKDHEDEVMQVKTEQAQEME
ncbi:hypothetical protein HK104_007818, partial [Borealophlyctis nickersoniae]